VKHDRHARTRVGGKNDTLANRNGADELVLPRRTRGAADASRLRRNHLCVGLFKPAEHQEHEHPARKRHHAEGGGGGCAKNPSWPRVSDFRGRRHVCRWRGAERRRQRTRTVRSVTCSPHAVLLSTLHLKNLFASNSRFYSRQDEASWWDCYINPRSCYLRLKLGRCHQNECGGRDVLSVVSVTVERKGKPN
jgi:hypothetical protein